MSKKTIESYKLKNGETRYMFRISLGTDPLTGKQKNTTRRSFKSKREAQMAYDRLKFELSNTAVKKRSVKTYMDIYLIWDDVYEKTVQDSTFLKTSRIFKNHILPAMGQYKIDKIDVATCQKHVEGWAKELKGFKKVKSYAAQIITFAMGRDYTSLVKNPFDLVENPIDKKRISLDEETFENFYSKEQLVRFLDCLKQNGNLKISTYFRLLAYSGMRKSEGLALTWGDINFSTREVRINKAIARGEGGIYLGPTKNGLPRTITLDDESLELLEKWKNAQEERATILGEDIKKQHQLVFPNSKNDLQDPNMTNRWLNSILDKFGLDHITPHGLRHTHCSLLFETGETFKAVQDRLGHKDMKTTMDVYAHVTQKTKDDTVEKFHDFLTD